MHRQTQNVWPYNNVLHVSIHQNYNQAPLSRKFKERNFMWYMYLCFF